jgi:MFS superfamily sulfate permease-like transporter
MIALVFLALGKTLLKHRPVALFVVVGGIVVARVLQLDERGVALLGAVPQGLPMPALPVVSRADINAIVPLAMACFVLAAVETTAIGRMFGAKHGYRLDATQEFLAIGSANLMAGLGSGLPVSGGMSQSLVNETGGARSPLSGLVAALITLLVALFFTGLLRNLPQPVLAAIILVAVTGLVQIETMRHIWRFSRTEFAVVIAALLGVLGSGLLNGVLLGVAISLLLLLRRASRPRVTELGRVPGTTYFADLTRHPENERVNDVLVVRNEGSLVYFNVDHVRDRISSLIAERELRPRLLVFFMGNVPHVDLAGVEFLIDLDATCQRSGIEFRLAEVHGEVREAVRRAHSTVAAKLAEAHQTVDDVVNKWRGALSTVG